MELRREFCNKVRPFIGRGARFATQAAAAADVGISPQRLNSYLRGKATPSHHVSAMISERWGIEFVLAGTALKPSQFRSRRATTEEKTAVQLSLFDKPQSVSNKAGSILVRVERKGASVLGFSLEIDLAMKEG